jgi:hypothetical protein
MLRRGPADVVEGEVMLATQELPVVPPRAAVTGTPVATGPAVTAPEPAATTPDTGPAPAVPPPAAPVPGPAVFPVPQTDEPSGDVPVAPAAATTGTGGDLPQRRPGGLLQPGADNSSRPASRNLPPDPDLVRTRLAGLASGLAAAARHIEPGRVANPSRYLDIGDERTHATIGQQDAVVPEPDPAPRQDGAR